MIDRAEDTSLMFAEAGEAAAAVARLLDHNQFAITALAERLRATPPRLVVTCARGSSDHAATYGKYLFEAMLGIPVVSAAPSIASVFDAPAGGAPDTLCIAISQSGRSPDLLATVEAHRRTGTHIVALVNDEESPLADAADTIIALRAGPERSVAATKSCLAAMAALAAIVAETAQDAALHAAVRTLPATLRTAFAQDWSPMVQSLTGARNLFVIGRGYGLGIAQEMALKLKETCALHAEAYSAAEVRHGPMTIVGADFPILAVAGSDRAGDSVRAVAAEFAARGARILLADAGDAGGILPTAAAHPAIEPLLALQSFYRAANALSLARGLDPDAPPHLAKVTRTV
ncbi:SIS domain-containing protein [Sphingomonas hengshuiensis]|uniref:Iron dicitrate transport regulator FecR n=1 Tax=Sphingomonas hengshuiensis TaxID=1609977 RepID=A0A7U4J7P9_9SPHN|nr:SIS domain-containing protein [Sphingomonas hengshuiensis]AJP71786.1 iron dicitrate transport regulator FecR [Sphingomonas hengshuiensis]